MRQIHVRLTLIMKFKKQKDGENFKPPRPHNKCASWLHYFCSLLFWYIKCEIHSPILIGTNPKPFCPGCLLS